MKTQPQPDPLIHTPLRLQIMTYLLEAEKTGFQELKKLTGTTQGNLSTHLARLEAARYIRIRKTFKGKRPYTEIAITPRGIQSLKKYFRWLRETLHQWDRMQGKRK